MVSILVLLEIGLGVHIFFLMINKTNGFNPCFVGNRSGSPQAFLKALMSISFQSLFCWKSVWESAPLFIMHIIKDSFNPCFVGNRSGSFVTCPMPYYNFQFQSLFCWKSVWEGTGISRHLRLYRVSILVLLEIGLGAIAE